MPQVPQDRHSLLALLDAPALDSLDKVALLVESSAFAGELETLLPGDLGDGSARGQVSLQDSVEAIFSSG